MAPAPGNRPCGCGRCSARTRTGKRRSGCSSRSRRRSRSRCRFRPCTAARRGCRENRTPCGSAGPRARARGRSARHHHATDPGRLVRWRRSRWTGAGTPWWRAGPATGAGAPRSGPGVATGVRCSCWTVSSSSRLRGSRQALHPTLPPRTSLHRYATGENASSRSSYGRSCGCD